MESLLDDNATFQEQKKFFINLISSVLIISIFLIYRFVMKLNLVRNDIELLVTFFETLGFILSMLSCTSFIVSFTRVKNDSVFIISLIYITLTISLGFQYMNSFNGYIYQFELYNYDTVTSWFLRCLLIILALLPDNKVKSFIVNNKIKSVLFIFFYIIFSGYVSNYFNLYTNETFFIFINIVLVIAYFVTTLSFFIIGFKEKEYIYFVISLSMLVLTIKTIYILFNINISQLSQMITLTLLGYLVLIVIISGSFVELLLHTNRIKKLNTKLKIFYDLNDNNKHTFLLICKVDGTILYANEKFKNNYSNPNLDPNKDYIQTLNTPYTSFRPTDEINEIRENLNKNGEWRGVIKVDDDGHYIDCSIHVINPKDKDSPISISYLDVSDIFNKELELEKLKVYNREQTEFISNISHELRTPIHIFYSTVQLLDKFCNENITDFKNTYEKYRKSLHTNCKRMLRLVNNIIDISKIETGILKGNLEYYNLISIIEDVTLSVKNYALVKYINIHFDTDCEEFISKCDCSMIERAVLNILSNAIKFTSENKNIYVNIFAQDDYIDIHIRDEGKGIPKNNLEHIFERFVQTDKSLTRENEGSGIGLSIVKSIIDLHEGHISVESKVGVGTTFKILLPKIGTNPEKCNVFDIDNSNTELELSDIYEVLV